MYKIFYQLNKHYIFLNSEILIYYLWLVEAEKENEDVRIEVMFDRLMLMDLRKNVAKLDVRAYAELKSYKDPPQVIHNILKSTLSLFYPEKAKKKEFDDWGACKMVCVDQINLWKCSGHFISTLWNDIFVFTRKNTSNAVENCISCFLENFICWLPTTFYQIL